MTKLLFIVALLFVSSAASAATLAIKCPAVVGLTATKQFDITKGKYTCFGSVSNAKKAGYSDANAKRKWRAVTTFSGAVDQTTDSFTISGSPWRVSWVYPGSSNFAVVVYDAVNNEYQKLLVNTIGATTAKTNYYGAGRYYLDISAGSDWTVTVEEYR